MAQYMFGTGQLFASNVGGGSPLRIGALQDVSVEFSGDIKQLFGQYQFALAVARGKTKIEGKFGTGNIDVAAFNSLFFQTTAGVVTGQKKQAINEAGVIPATPFKITVANGATFFRDLGVTDVLTGNSAQAGGGRVRPPASTASTLPRVNTPSRRRTRPRPCCSTTSTRMRRTAER
jgi:hypothetical protein